jgi:hypothetical protein
LESRHVQHVLVIYYSQSGQLSRILRSMLAPLDGAEGIELIWWEVRAQPPYPFPWPLTQFFDAFPESVLMAPCGIESLPAEELPPVDLVVLAYTIWYLAPSIPISAFLRSPAAVVLRGHPVVTVVNARDKWISGQEKMKEALGDLGARLVDNAVFTHAGTPFQNTIMTLRWMWTGKKEAFRDFPSAGVSEEEIRNAARFGAAIRRALEQGTHNSGTPMLRGLGAAHTDSSTVMQESIARPIFTAWARWSRAAGRWGRLPRLLMLLLFAGCLGLLLLIAAPAMLVYRLCIAPFRRTAIARQIAHYEEPSGSSTENMRQTMPGAGVLAN